ncbi:hypothetical protein, partial [Streptomyces sp. NPDC057854]
PWTSMATPAALSRTHPDHGRRATYDMCSYTVNVVFRRSIFEREGSMVLERAVRSYVSAVIR